MRRNAESAVEVLKMMIETKLLTLVMLLALLVGCAEDPVNLVKTVKTSTRGEPLHAENNASENSLIGSANDANAAKSAQPKASSGRVGNVVAIVSPSDKGASANEETTQPVSSSEEQHVGATGNKTDSSDAQEALQSTAVDEAESTRAAASAVVVNQSLSNVQDKQTAVESSSMPNDDDPAVDSSTVNENGNPVRSTPNDSTTGNPLRSAARNDSPAATGNRRNAAIDANSDDVRAAEAGIENASSSKEVESSNLSLTDNNNATMPYPSRSDVFQATGEVHSAERSNEATSSSDVDNQSRTRLQESTANGNNQSAAVPGQAADTQNGTIADLEKQPDSREQNSSEASSDGSESSKAIAGENATVAGSVRPSEERSQSGSKNSRAAKANSQKPFLGVKNQRGVSAARIGYIHKDGPADVAGLRLGDTIVGINNQEVASFSNLVSELAKYSPGTVVKISFTRDGKRWYVLTRLTERK